MNVHGDLSMIGPLGRRPHSARERRLLEEGLGQLAQLVLQHAQRPKEHVCQLAWQRSGAFTWACADQADVRGAAEEIFGDMPVLQARLQALLDDVVLLPRRRVVLFLPGGSVLLGPVTASGSDPRRATA